MSYVRTFREYSINFNSFASWLNNGLGLKDRETLSKSEGFFLNIHYTTVLLQEAGFKNSIDMNVFKCFWTLHSVCGSELLKYYDLICLRTTQFLVLCQKAII